MIARMTRRHGVCRRPMWMVAASMLMSVAATAQDPAAEPPAESAPFTPGEISIGDPIPLPFAPPGRTPPAGPPEITVPPPATSAPTAPSGAAAATTAGQGWLGLAIAESSVAGRWVVEEVVPGSPAAKAGIRPGDEIRALGGVPLTSTDETAQMLTAIAAGQEVKVSVARADQVSDVVLKAVPRPKAAIRDWQAAGVPTSAEVAVPAADALPSATAIPTTPTPRPAAAIDTAPRSVVNPFAAPGPAAVEPAIPSVTLPPAAAFATAPAAIPATSSPLPSPRPALDRPAAAGTLPSGTPAAAAGRGRTALGVRSVAVDPAIQSRFGLTDARGAYVIGVVQDLPASRAGVPPGSVIVALDERPVASPDDLTSLVLKSPVDRPVTLHYVLPGGQRKQADVVLQPLSLPLERALVGETAAPAFARRPTAAAEDATTLAREIEQLRSRLESLERRLGALQAAQAAGR